MGFVPGKKTRKKDRPKGRIGALTHSVAASYSCVYMYWGAFGSLVSCAACPFVSKMTHQTVVGKDPDLLLVPNTPPLFSNEDSDDSECLPPTPKRTKRSSKSPRSSRNLLDAFYKELEKEDQLNDITNTDRSPAWQHQPPYAHYRNRKVSNNESPSSCSEGRSTGASHSDCSLNSSRESCDDSESM